MQQVFYTPCPCVNVKQDPLLEYGKNRRFSCPQFMGHGRIPELLQALKWLFRHKTAGIKSSAVSDFFLDIPFKV